MAIFNTFLFPNPRARFLSDILLSSISDPKSPYRIPMSGGFGSTPLQLSISSQSDIDEIDSLIVHSQGTVLSAAPSSPPPPPPPMYPLTPLAPPSPSPTSPRPDPLPRPRCRSDPDPDPDPDPTRHAGIASDGFGSPPDTLTEPVWDTVKRDAGRIVSNLKPVVFPNPNREDPGKALRDWDLWGPFFFILFLGLVLFWSATAEKSLVFAVAFAVLAVGAVIVTLNVLLLGGHIIFFQSISVLGYCLFPSDVGALICMLKDNVIMKIIVVAIGLAWSSVAIVLAWSSWAVYPFMFSAVVPQRKALALYSVFLMYISVGFFIVAIS